MKQQTIGLLMGIYNEAERIKDCLDHHLPYVDEAVIVIQESTDGTERIVAEYVEKHPNTPITVLHYPVMGCSEATLQFGADALSTDWILYVDADERFPQEFLTKMHEIAETDKYDGFWLERDNYFDVQLFNDSVPIEPKTMQVKHPARDRQFRLTRKSMSWFPPQVHVRCRVRGPKAQGIEERVDTLDYTIYHRKSLDEQWIDNKQYTPAVRLVNAMEMTKRYELIDLPLIESVNKVGTLVVAEITKHIPFAVKRAFWIFDVPERAERGHHANRNLNEVLVCLQGSVTVILDDGHTHREFVLNDRTKGLFIKNKLWITLKDFGKDTILLCFADQLYDKNDAIRDYNEFLREVAA